MVLFGLILWVWSLARLLVDASQVERSSFESDLSLRQGGTALVGILVGSLLGRAWPQEGPVAAPLEEGQTMPEGPGFIHAGDRVPGEVRALGAGIDRPASTLAKPGTIRALQVYLQEAPGLYRALSQRYPALQTALLDRAKAVPTGELRTLSGREVGQWLRDEQSALSTFSADGLDVGELPALLEEASKSGLADPDLEKRIPNP
jgi:hypothetical protein